ncbi:retinoic acid receptor responder protein 2 isoform X1 [Rhineura floridana]|uniref:retinoic acid receptor responder protein 2 isoform X1 n=1 Tax=Rhineura floridana TaxID=261503 RepID=UPI002AC823AA|nr:retinoic acid receptor responder protein 2 isoform X1 [Rhineura floridana]
MKGLIALCLGLLALADASRSPIQQKALDLVLEFFHSRDLVQSTFKEQAVTQVAEMGLPMGTYVQLEVDLVQTLCRKQQWRTQSCRIKLGGRKQKCLACFKFGSSNSENILDQSLRCLSEQNPIFQEADFFKVIFFIFVIIKTPEDKDQLQRGIHLFFHIYIEEWLPQLRRQRGSKIRTVRLSKRQMRSTTSLASSPFPRHSRFLEDLHEKCHLPPSGDT